MKFHRPILVILNPIYWVIAFLRNLFYDLGIFKSEFFSLPIIVVGNLSTGGTGKTPHTEYVVKLLKDKFKIAVLSRGYGRISAGFQEVKTNSPTTVVGDEPAQIKNKFPNVEVAVDANRVAGIKRLIAQHENLQAVVLDDAFQHRKLQAGYYILLTPFHDLYVNDWVLPGGNLREQRRGADRANLIVVTKCPSDMSLAQRESIIKRLKPKSHQHVFFSHIIFGDAISNDELFSYQKPFVLITGIADAQPLLTFLNEKKAAFKHLDFSDHHHFSNKEIAKIIEEVKSGGFNQVLTTEKDFQRLDQAQFSNQQINLAYLPIEIEFVNEGSMFSQKIVEFISSYE